MKRNEKNARGQNLNHLTTEEYLVTQEAYTERPFENRYDQEFREGIYVDIVTGEPLFSSHDKFNSGCGWPAFSKPLEERLIEEKEDHSHGMKRVEVVSSNSDAHLGHVFDDGPGGSLRYCINSASLKFIPKEELENAGLGQFLSLFE